MRVHYPDGFRLVEVPLWPDVTSNVPNPTVTVVVPPLIEAEQDRVVKRANAKDPCHKHIPYPSYEEALRAARWIHDGTAPERCHWCGLWHLTSWSAA